MNLRESWEEKQLDFAAGLDETCDLGVDDFENFGTQYCFPATMPTSVSMARAQKAPVRTNAGPGRQPGGVQGAGPLFRE